MTDHFTFKDRGITVIVFICGVWPHWLRYYIRRFPLKWTIPPMILHIFVGTVLLWNCVHFYMGLSYCFISTWIAYQTTEFAYKWEEVI